MYVLLTLSKKISAFTYTVRGRRGTNAPYHPWDHHVSAFLIIQVAVLWVLITCCGGLGM